MKFLYSQLALLSLLLCSPAQAQEVEYGTGLICDTAQQAEHSSLTSTGTWPPR